jgi:hypothetical protein
MGHHSIQVTVDIYGHLVPEANRKAVDRVDDRNGRNPRATTNAFAFRYCCNCLIIKYAREDSNL